MGLVTGTCFAEAGNTVTCVDIDEEKIRNLKDGKIPIYEQGLEQLVNRNITEERLYFTTDLEEGIKDAVMIFLVLPTPEDVDGSADLRFMLTVADRLGPMLTRYTIIVDKSTAPVGTSEKIKRYIAAGTTVDFDVAVNPEFLREGIALEDFMKPDRIVVGTKSDRVKKMMTMLYSPFVGQDNPVIFMEERSAELTKYAANSFLATRISFMNEMANLSELLGCDVDDVRRGIGADSRIGNRFLFAGIGYGGSCFPKDVKALVKLATETGYDLRILNAVMSVNEIQRVKLVDTVKHYFNGSLKGKTLAIWGLSFKPHTDDIREAPSLYTIDEFLDEGAIIKVYDPEAMGNARKFFGNKIQYFSTPYEAAHSADALIIMTEWPEFRSPDFEFLSTCLVNKVIFDGRNLYDLSMMRESGFTYYSIGREVIEYAQTPEVLAEKFDFKPVGVSLNLHTNGVKK